MLHILIYFMLKGWYQMTLALDTRIENNYNRSLQYSASIMFKALYEKLIY